MKKCPECGNPSYDGAPVCGNCGYNFPKPKSSASKREDIFQQEPKAKKDSNDESTVNILKNNKKLIGAIILITIIVIFLIFLTGSTTKTTAIQTSDLNEYNSGDFSFKYPENWEKVNLTDPDHEDAIFFKNENNVTIEFYNVTSDFSSLKEVTQSRLSVAQNDNSNVELVETITLDGRNASNIILENANGNYTKYVSMYNKGELYVFKIIGDSIKSLNSDDIESALNSSDII